MTNDEPVLQSEWEQQQAELARLRTENRQWRSACADYTTVLAAQDTELRAAVEQINKLTAEVRRLREALSYIISSIELGVPILEIRDYAVGVLTCKIPVSLGGWPSPG
jgi:uncharacterized protein YqiB (DUF1249 family)